ncbi:alpha/beta hydrolase [Xanthomonas theicola]|uniref:alpha/beta hydrolase n=1 Tax=Xanthomonas theicola TaxID=56464 RepID=UPI000FF8AADD|nr:alpha/beta hydrolase [Xanthomonas theicola]QNH23510.1 alpha/beta hydrolase [Xanthomonas theicola]
MKTNASAMTTQLRDGADAFSVTILEAERSSCIGFFAVGRGGSPLRHLPLLQSVANRGCTVIAPHFTMLASAIPTKEELDTRIRRFEIAADGCARADQPIIGIGHSIGALTLLVLAGGQARTLSGDRVVVGSKWKFARLALFAPPADFFRYPGALDDVDVQTLLRVGGKDTMTPPAHAEFLKEKLAQKAPVELGLDENAGHFTYMDELPPHVSDPQRDRSAFLSALADAVGRFVTASR